MLKCLSQLSFSVCLLGVCGGGSLEMVMDG